MKGTYLSFMILSHWRINLCPIEAAERKHWVQMHWLCFCLKELCDLNIAIAVSSLWSYSQLWTCKFLKSQFLYNSREWRLLLLQSLPDQLTNHFSYLFLLSLLCVAECSLVSDPALWDMPEPWGWAREGKHTGEANRPRTSTKNDHSYTGWHHHAPPALLILLPDLCTLLQSNQSHHTPPTPAWPCPSCGSCHPRSWASSWSALGSSGAWCCCISPSNREPATRAVLCCDNRSWTSASATSKP